MALSPSDILAMSKHRLSIWWVDDEPSRIRQLAITRIEKAGSKARERAAVELILLKTQEECVAFEQRLVNAKKRGPLPDLIILDQNLNRVAAGGRELRGSSLAVSVRAEAPSVPIAGVTAVKMPKIPDLQQEQFIELFTLDALQSGSRIPDLYAIIGGFGALISEFATTRQPARRPDRVLALLGSPTEDRELLLSCLPGEFLGQWDAETPHVFARWIWHTFTGRAGFLHDDLEIATLLGVNEKGLNGLLPALTGCEYAGVFASASRRRWWVSRVRYVVRRDTGGQVTEPLWKLGRQLLMSKHSADLSRCHGRCDAGCVPDVVAFEDETLRERVQARSEDTKPLETDTPPVGFERQRVFWRK
jgi:hypothetical protein